MEIVLIDNRDSFTYNLVHYLEQDDDVKVNVMDHTLPDYDKLASCDGIVLSPGPGLPQQSGKLMEIISRTVTIKKMLGVCLGHQALGIHFGASLMNLPKVFHGKATSIFPSEKKGLFLDLPDSFQGGRYHSWVIDPATLPASLVVTATDGEGSIMAIRHRDLPVCGVQFHPESILSEYGKELIKNWIRS